MPFFFCISLFWIDESINTMENQKGEMRKVTAAVLALVSSLRSNNFFYLLSTLSVRLKNSARPIRYILKNKSLEQKSHSKHQHDQWRNTFNLISWEKYLSGKKSWWNSWCTYYISKAYEIPPRTFDREFHVRPFSFFLQRSRMKRYCSTPIFYLFRLKLLS